MPKAQPHSLNDFTKWLQRASDFEISLWVNKVLNNDWHLFPYELGRLSPEEVLLTIFRHGDDPKIQNKLWSALATRANQVAWRTKQPEYLVSLLAAIGFVNATPALDLLIKTANRSKLKERFLITIALR